MRWLLPTGASLESPVLHENEQHRARNNGRIVGKQAQIIPTQGSTKVQVAASMIESRMNQISVTVFQGGIRHDAQDISSFSKILSVTTRITLATQTLSSISLYSVGVGDR